MLQYKTDTQRITKNLSYHIILKRIVAKVSFSTPALETLPINLTWASSSQTSLFLSFTCRYSLNPLKHYL